MEMNGKTRIAIVVFVLLAILAAIFLYLRISFSLLPAILGSQPPPSGPASVSAYVVQRDVFTYNSSKSPVFYSLISYNTTNASSVNASLSVFYTNPFQKIYLLNVTGYCKACFPENAVQGYLAAYLSQYDLIRNSSSFSFISISQIAQMPNNSIVIVPSGLIPISLLNSTGATLFTLLNRGDTIIYAGQGFNQSIGAFGLTFVTPPSIMSQLISVGLQPVPYVSSSQQQQPRLNLSFRYPTFTFPSGLVYQNISYTASANGTLVAFSNFPTTSWSQPQSIARDIAKVLAERIWMRRVANATLTSLGSGGRAGIFAQVPAFNRNVSFSAFPLNTSYSLVSVSASNANGTILKQLAFRNSFKASGLVSVPPVIGATEKIPMLIQISNLTRSLLMHVSVYDRNLTSVGSIYIGPVNTIYGVISPASFSYAQGYYVLRLKDINNNTYASSVFYLANATVIPQKIDFKNATFAFELYSNGLPVSNATYSIDLNGAYNETGEISNGKIQYNLPKGTIISYGNQVFRLNMLGSVYYFQTGYQATVLNIPTIYIEFAVAIIAVVLLNLVLQPPNRDEYYIDVPEFPPSKREQLKVQKSEVLGVFDKVNYYYRWKYMPLTVDELKLGIGNYIRAKGLPISVTTQNTSMLLSALLAEGSILGASGFYAPKSWTEASRHSVEYLAIFRKLRDYCVSHAMLFTDLDSNAISDALVTKDSKQMAIFIYASSSPMRKITLSRDSRISILFLNEESSREFLKELYDSVGKDAEVLKLGIEYSYIKLIDADHLSQLSL